MRPVTAAVYARYSSELQNETSIEDQIASCREFAEIHDYDVEDSLIFVDRGISAASRHNRPELLRCIRRAPEYQVLLVWDFSRLARNLEDHGWVENQLVAAGAKAISVSNGLELGAGPRASAVQCFDLGRPGAGNNRG